MTNLGLGLVCYEPVCHDIPDQEDAEDEESGWPSLHHGGICSSTSSPVAVAGTPS